MDLSILEIKDKRIFFLKKKKEKYSKDNKKRKNPIFRTKNGVLTSYCTCMVHTHTHTRIASISKNHHEIVAVHTVYTGVPNNTAGSSIVW